MIKLKTPRQRVEIPRKRTRGERANLSREKIAEKAMELIEAGGPVVVLRLAKALGVVPATITSHFPGGAYEIVKAVVRSRLRDLARPFKPNDSPEDYLRDLFEGVLNKMRETPRIVSLAVPVLAADLHLAPLLAERLLQCSVAEGVPEAALPTALQRLIGRLCEMILIECHYGSETNPHSLEALPLGEFALLKAVSPHLSNKAVPLPADEVARLYAREALQLIHSCR